MRVLVTGREGQVARALQEWFVRDGDRLVEFAARPEFDLTDPESIRSTVDQFDPDVIINTAAYTGVDAAEEDEATAFAVNGLGPGVLASAANNVGARIIHISTDYVFSGTGSRPYDESDPVGPIGVYGRSKLAGEIAVRAACDDHVILRTAWVYSPFSKNFMLTVLRLAGDGKELTIVDDQVGTPTSAHDLAEAIVTILDDWSRGSDRGLGRTYHVAGSGETSWCGLARHILVESSKHGGPTAPVRAISTAEFKARAKRPANSRLNSSLFAEDFGYRAPHWMESTARVVERLLTVENDAPRHSA